MLDKGLVGALVLSSATMALRDFDPDEERVRRRVYPPKKRKPSPAKLKARARRKIASKSRARNRS